MVIATDKYLIPVDQVSFIVLKETMAYVCIGSNPIVVPIAVVEDVPFIMVGKVLVNPARVLYIELATNASIHTDAGVVKALKSDIVELLAKLKGKRR